MADNKGIFSGLGFNNGGRGNAAKISSVAMFIAVTFFFVVIVFFFVLYIYGLYYLRQRTTARSRTRFILFNRESPVLSRGLDPAILRSLPVMVYRPSDFQDGLECAVCISEIAEGEEIRLLPKCNHGFHLECIDMWFHSHSTCPLCRCRVIQEVSAAGQSSSLAAEDEAGHDAVQSLGNQEQDNNGSLGSESVLVISIPLRTTEGMFTSLMPPLQSSRGSMQDRKSPVEARSPAESKLGSFRRPLSRGNRNGDSCCSSSRIGDVEQGMVGSVPSN